MSERRPRINGTYGMGGCRIGRDGWWQKTGTRSLMFSVVVVVSGLHSLCGPRVKMCQNSSCSAAPAIYKKRFCNLTNYRHPPSILFHFHSSYILLLLPVIPSHSHEDRIFRGKFCESVIGNKYWWSNIKLIKIILTKLLFSTQMIFLY